MKKITFLLAVCISSLFVCSCATTIDTYYSPKTLQMSVKTIYLVNKGGDSQDMDERIKRNLINRKVKVVMGPDTKKVSSEDLIVKYNETWKPDLPTSMQAFDILAFDPAGDLVASSHWKNSSFSSLTTMNTIVTDSLDTIFEKIKIEPQEMKP